MNFNTNGMEGQITKSNVLIMLSAAAIIFVYLMSSRIMELFA